MPRAPLLFFEISSRVMKPSFTTRKASLVRSSAHQILQSVCTVGGPVGNSIGLYNWVQFTGQQKGRWE